MKRSAKGLPPKAASYITQSDHRSQVERADFRQAKKAMRKQRRTLDRQLTNDDDESLPHDVIKITNKTSYIAGPNLTKHDSIDKRDTP